MKLEEQFKLTKPGDLGIIGDPVEHSLSPIMQNTALKMWKMAFEDRELGVPTYYKFHVKPDELSEAIQLIKKYQLKGINVTIPHKVSIGQYVDLWDSYAKKSGAINTLFSIDGTLKGFNTDGDGFRRTIERDLDLDMEEKSALVLGAGGTARVILYQLVAMNAQAVYVWSRDLQKAQTLIDSMGEEGAVVKAVSEQQILSGIGADSALVVNATSVGLGDNDGMPLESLNFHSNQVVFDVIYHRDTRFMKHARQAGARVGGGEGMLLYQGARSFEIWTGTPAPLELMRNALMSALKGKP